MNKTIREVIQNIHELHINGFGNQWDKNFHEESKKLDDRERRILEVSNGSDLLKVTRIYHHCNQVLRNCIIDFKDKILTDRLTSVADKNKFIKMDYVRLLSARIDAALCESMVRRFPELNEYSMRWDDWKSNYDKKLHEILSITEVYDNPKRESLRLELFKVNYQSQHDILKNLINDLMFITKGAEPYIFQC